MDARSVKRAQVEVSRGPASEDEALASAVPHFVEQPEPLDEVRQLVRLAPSAREHLSLLCLPDMPGDFFLKIYIQAAFGSGVSSDAQRVRGMRFVQSGAYTRILRDISVSVGNGNIQRAFRLSEYLPLHDVHRGGVAERPEAALQLQFNLSFMVCIVACFAERDEVVGRISAGLARFNVMDAQDAVLRLAVAALALVPVAPQDVLADVQEIELRPLLVIRTGDFGVFDALHVELRDFDDDA